jgi:murein DD-endopeptidase MepM/ murein hydrolase activator NlpD
MMLDGIGTYASLEGPQRSSASYRKAPPRFLGTLDDLAPAPVADARYTVQKGDTLAEIVRRQLKAQGKPADNTSVFDAVRDVAAKNGLPNANRIHIGQNLDLSALGGAPVSVSMPAEPALDVATLPQLPGKSAAKPSSEGTAVESKALPEAAPPQAAAKRNASGGGRNALIGPVAAFSAHRSVLISPGPQGGPAHNFGRDLINELQPEVRYPAARAGGRPDLNLLIDRLLSKSGLESAASAPAVIEVPDATGMPWERAVNAPTRLTSGFGARRDPFTKRKDFHDGLDLAAPSGSDIHPLMEGTVTFSGWKSGYGRVVIVDHGDGIETLYGHNAKNLVAAGQQVDEKTVLGHVGSSGRSTGPHLHLEVRQNGKAIDPIAYLSGPETQETAIARND